MINAADFQAMTPWLVLTGAAVVVLLQITIARVHGASVLLSVVGLVATLATIPYAAQAAPRRVTPLFLVDGFALFFLALLLAGALVVVLLSTGPAGASSQRRGEHYLLLLLATLGAAVLPAATHFAALILGVETLSVALFTLTAYPVLQTQSVEAGLKYLVLAGVSAAILMFGIALVYAGTGSLVLAAPIGMSPYALAGALLILAGLGFKLSLVPFHLWTPDVYQGAPPTVTAYLATVSKGALFVLLLRYLSTAAGDAPTALTGVLAGLGVVTMLAGNLLALQQRDLKRLLAYSSIAHMGYLLVPIVGGGALAVETFGYYLAAYFVMTLMAFGVVTVMETETGGRDHSLDRYRGLAWQRPWLTSVLAVAMLGLAGMPLTAGFVAKFYLFVAGVDAQRWLLLAALVAGSAIGLFYYLRVIGQLLRQDAEAAVPRSRSFLLGHTTLWALMVLLVYLGVLPATLVQWVQASAVTGLF